MLHAYEGFYARFDTPDKTVGSMMMGADDLVGDVYTIEMRVVDGQSTAWLVNKFGAERGYLGPQDSRRVQLALGREMKVVALLSFLAYSDTPDPGIYWGEMAFICYNPADKDVMGAFVKRIAGLMADGKRPVVDLNAKMVQQIFDEADWVPTARVPLPDRKKKGFAILKDRQSASERAIERGRAGNKGCYAVSILFLVIVGFALVYGGLKLLGIV